MYVTVVNQCSEWFCIAEDTVRKGAPYHGILAEF